MRNESDRLPVSPRGEGLFSDVRHVARTGSTNADVAALARSGAREGVVVVAGHQSAGRGRRDRRWSAGPGDALLASILLRPEVPVERFGLIPLAVGVAIVDAARALGVDDAGLKWPNDVLVGGAKLAGILSEFIAEGGGRSGGAAVVVGFGVNLRATPAEVPDAVSLADLTGESVDRDVFLRAVLDRFASHYATLGDGSIVALATARMTTLGREVDVERPGSPLRGRAVGLDEGGRLVVDTPSGAVVVAAGDVVHLRPR
ncbi:MAG: biotin--[acetyl-CoA-carboxylase] ligase [Acidimicrobiales bacterium]